MTPSMDKDQPRRLWFAPEVVQTSAMDCGPAGLKCLLEGFRIPVSYGRLREACQTDVDGTSIDTIEAVANELGVCAEQVMIPVDHVFLETACVLPALVVVRHADGATHFVVAWRRIGSWLQVMDPATGRRWVRFRQFIDDIYRHETGVPAADWRDWAASEDFLAPLRERLSRLGAGDEAISQLIQRAAGDDGWLGFGAFDASTRLVSSMIEAGGVEAGTEATRLLAALFHQTVTERGDIFRLIPPHYWSVTPETPSADPHQQRLVLRGAVLLRISGPDPRTGDAGSGHRPAAKPLSRELAAALNERPENPLRSLWELVRCDRLLAPSALIGAAIVAAGAMVLEALLFRGLLDLGALLGLSSQRLGAVLVLLTFVSLVLAFRIPIASESLRLGRRLDLRLRSVLLRKLPNLADRYFHSRPISDMADRSHSVHLIRAVPGMVVQFVQSLSELLLTVIGIALIDPTSGLLALAVVTGALTVPAAFQPMINERDLRVRNHFAALNVSYLDALLGLVPIRTHRAEFAVRHQHESLLVEWVKSNRRLVRASILASGVQSVICVGLVAVILIEHFVRLRGVTGADLLLVYWALKLPAIGNTLTALAHQYPMQRNVLLRLLEPLAAPDQLSSPAEDASATTTAPGAAAPAEALERRGGTSLRIDGGSVCAAGQPILRDIDLSVCPGEHVAIVGLSGAGKSTLIGVLLGWHRLAAGRLLIDGTEARDEVISALRRNTAWVDPAIQIWNRPFLDNIDYGLAEADFARSARAIGAANLRGVLQKLPDGLQTRLGEGGALLSGGEGQRVRLARALAQSDVRLALLDEPFRGLDRERRAALLSEARRHWQEATLLCVTHDVSETLSFDRVLVIEDGMMVEDDDPIRLAKRPSRYRELLETERLVRDGLWAGPQWRRIRVEGGEVEDSDPFMLRQRASRNTA